MATGFAVHNAPTDHGGFIPSTQVRNSQQGNLFVRAGDGHFCPKCKTWSTVIKSHDHVIFDGKAVAYAGDKLTCGARILTQQSHVVGDKENYYGGSTLSNLKLINSKEHLNNNFTPKEQYEHFYVENYKTNIFVQHKAVISANEQKSKGVGILQMLSGAVSYFLNYKITDNELFVSASINAHPLSNDAKVYPFGKVIISREDQIYTTKLLEKNKGFWNTDEYKSPVGSCTIILPPPNLQVIKVKVILGYRAQYNDAVGQVVPVPASVSHGFSISSFARKI